MGFDVYGENPTEEVGEYFRANVWWWHPLWKFTSQLCDSILTEEDISQGSYNDGHVIDEIKAGKMVKMLRFSLSTGHAKKHVEEYEKTKSEIPLEKCDICDGTGKRTDMEVPNGCNKCDGKGEHMPWSTWYHISVKAIEEFTDFIEASGGFSIR